MVSLYFTFIESLPLRTKQFHGIWGSVRYCVYLGCIYLIRNTVKTVILYITILFYYFNDKVFSASLLQSSVSQDCFRNHSNMLIWCSRNIIFLKLFLLILFLKILFLWQLWLFFSGFFGQMNASLLNKSSYIF